MDSRLPALALAVLLVFAGCSGGTAPAADTATTAPPAESTSTTETTTTTTTTASSVPTTEATTTATTPTQTTAVRRVVAYSDLDAEVQAMFDRAREQGQVSEYEVDAGAFRPLVVNEYVRKDGTLYAVDGYRNLEPRSVVVDTEAASGPPDTDSAVVASANLSASAQADFDALRNGSVSTLEYRPEAFPFPGEPLDDSESYVTVGGEYYRLELAHGDVYEYRIAVSNTSE
jgi:hypothetical protein